MLWFIFILTCKFFLILILFSTLFLCKHKPIHISWGWVLLFERFLSPWYILNFDLTTFPLCILWSCVHGLLVTLISFFHFSSFSLLCIPRIHWKICVPYSFLSFICGFTLVWFFLVFLLVLPKSAKDKVWGN